MTSNPWRQRSAFNVRRRGSSGSVTRIAGFFKDDLAQPEPNAARPRATIQSPPSGGAMQWTGSDTLAPLLFGNPFPSGLRLAEQYAGDDDEAGGGLHHT